MSYTIASEKGVVRVRHTGELTLAEVKASREEVGRIVAEEGVRKILVDLREGTLAQTTLDLFEFSASCGQVFPLDTMIAVVYTPGKTGPDEDAAFAETVARNVGTRLRMFGSMEEASSWLGGE